MDILSIDRKAAYVGSDAWCSREGHLQKFSYCCLNFSSDVGHKRKCSVPILFIAI